MIAGGSVIATRPAADIEIAASADRLVSLSAQDCGDMK
jgi:hypothetical protein